MILLQLSHMLDNAIIHRMTPAMRSFKKSSRFLFISTNEMSSNALNMKLCKSYHRNGLTFLYIIKYKLQNVCFISFSFLFSKNFCYLLDISCLEIRWGLFYLSSFDEERKKHIDGLWMDQLPNSNFFIWKIEETLCEYRAAA